MNEYEAKDNAKDEDPSLRIEQIDAEMVQIDQSMKQTEGQVGDAASAKRAELNERMQQLKSEKNMLIKRLDD